MNEPGYCTGGYLLSSASPCSLVHRALLEEGDRLTRPPLGQRAGRRQRTLSTVNLLGPGVIIDLRWDLLVCPYRSASANISSEPHGSQTSIASLARLDLEFV